MQAMITVMKSRSQRIANDERTETEANTLDNNRINMLPM